MADLLGYSQRVKCPASRPRLPLAGSPKLYGSGMAADVHAAHSIGGSQSAALVPPARSFLQPRTTHRALSQLAVNVDPNNFFFIKNLNLGESSDPGAQVANGFSVFARLLGKEVRSSTSLPALLSGVGQNCVHGIGNVQYSGTC